MATCRRCFHSSSSVPASPRVGLPLQEANGATNSANVVAAKEAGDEPVVKKALFDENAENNRPNGVAH